jgi:hypothetical protein
VKGELIHTEITEFEFQVEADSVRRLFMKIEVKELSFVRL